MRFCEGGSKYNGNPHTSTCFIITLRLKFNILSPPNKNPPKAETGGEVLI